MIRCDVYVPFVPKIFQGCMVNVHQVCWQWMISGFTMIYMDSEVDCTLGNGLLAYGGWIRKMASHNGSCEVSELCFPSCKDEWNVAVCGVKPATWTQGSSRFTR